MRRASAILLLAATPFVLSVGSVPAVRGAGLMEENVVLTDFAALVLQESPNRWLVAAEGLPGPRADASAPRFDINAEGLARLWVQVVEQEPRVTILAIAPDGLAVEVEQRSAVFGFVDRISARFLGLDGGRSTLSVYSRSAIGYWDLGVNRKRVERWLGLLTAAVAREGTLRATGREQPGDGS
jgi:uncharacterized protein (DUF1499 family)